MLKTIIRYRQAGNCFVNCLIYGCQLLGDTRLNCKQPELKIFNVETLNSSLLEKEFPPALNYLLNKNYEIKIIDPEPEKDSNWGENLNLLGKNLLKRSYRREDVDELIKNNWCIIISTLDSSYKSPHAVLIYGNTIKDPENPVLWKSIIGLDKLDDYINRKSERFLLAYRKLT